MAEANEARYNILKWNGQDGDNAVFVVRDNQKGMYSLFTPDKLSDLTWVKQDLSNAGDYKGWEDFEEEPIQNLEDVVF